MKLFTASLIASMAAVASGQATLAEKWNLTEPTFSYDSNTFELTFDVTDFITSTQAKYSLWTSPDCQSDGGRRLDGEDGSFTPFTTHTIEENAALIAGGRLESGVFSGRQAVVKAAFDPAVVSSAESVAAGVYSEEVVNNQMIATIQMCIRFGVWTENMDGVTTPVEVNFLETLLTLFVDLTDGFEIGAIEVEPKDRLIRTANQAYEVNGYECTADSTDRFTAVEPRNQGDIIYVCVTPEQEAQDDGIFMRSIDDFAWTRDTTIRQVAIVGNAAAGNALTDYSPAACQGQLVCRFSSILFAAFYASAGLVGGEGVASMQFGQEVAARRQLRAGDRELQEEEGAGAAEFELTFDVNQAEARTRNSGAGSISMGVAAIAAVAATML